MNHYWQKIVWVIALIALLGLVYNFIKFKESESRRIQDLEQRINMMHEQKPAPAQTAQNVVVQEQWRDLQEKLKNAVVQIFAQVGAIDLLQPYKTPSQYQATGSGFFINDYEIITNAHVVNEAKALWFQLPTVYGKEQIDVEVVGVSPDRDLALLRISEETRQKIVQILGQVPHLELGDSNMVQRADEIMTLGYPLGQQGLKSTVGVVSGREQHLIQIDAPINPGNSGGPSVNRACQVVGINTLYAPDAQNVGYVVPINELKVVLDDLRRVKLLRKPFLGIIFNNASESLTTYLGNPLPGGLYVVDVYKGSPLAKAGIQRGDMICAINGLPIDIYGELMWQGEKIALIDYVSGLKLGQELQLVVYRKGTRKDIALVFEQTELLPVRRVYPGYEKIDYEIVAGMVVQQLALNHLPALVNTAPALAKYAEMKYQMDPAVIITHIFPDSQAHRSRSLMPGSILKEVNGESVRTMQELRSVLNKGIASGNLTLETQEGVFVVFPFKKVLEEQVRLARDYFFPLSDTMRMLLVQAENNKWFKVQADDIFLAHQTPDLVPFNANIPSGIVA